MGSYCLFLQLLIFCYRIANSGILKVDSDNDDDDRDIDWTFALDKKCESPALVYRSILTFPTADSWFAYNVLLFIINNMTGPIVVSKDQLNFAYFSLPLATRRPRVLQTNSKESIIPN